MRMTPPLDMSTYALQTLIYLMLAQAQECVWQKAAMDQLRDGTIARLALQIADFYDLAYMQSANAAIQTVFPSTWIIHMQIKQLHFTAAAQFRKSCECISQDRYGEEIARLQLAAGFVRQAFDLTRQEKSKGDAMVAVLNDLRSLQQIIASNLARAEKDNDVIYLETIPAPTTLPTILKTQMVKATAPREIIDPVSLMNEGSTMIGLALFQKLVPFAVHQAASVYVDRKERLIKEDIIGKLEELKAVYDSSIESLGINQILAMNGLPVAILKGAEEVRIDGGSQSLYDMWEEVQKASTKNAEILEEVFNALDEEHELDESLRSKYSNVWKRPESHQLTQQLVAQGKRHQQTLLAAQKADLIVRGKLDTWATIIDVLALPKEELENSIPFDDDSPLALIKSLVDNMNNHIKAREHLIQTVKKVSNGDDISPTLLRKAAQLTSNSSLVKIEAAQFEDLFAEELKKYDEFIKKVDEEEERQSKILRQLNEVCNQPHVSGKREKALQNLNQAYLKYKEIKTNLSEGLKVVYREKKRL
ncbi:BRO1-like domain-containing protein [Cokeromyces recurvatus]|uniref:BRO1-like domain-containing protein n=1 Tax=Cokeromyces recurvatus TaxID=90255 RepID=UPI00221FFE4A|nr:BRO1-like domain-containing protein [Cokeromyces recurvatus]KAI7906675.1 BRO1-like domain-containing protein [Cokeromyces recurvatus]